MGRFQLFRNKIDLKELVESTRKDLVYYDIRKIKEFFKKRNHIDL